MPSDDIREDGETSEEEWTYASGLRRGILWTTVATVVIGALFCTLTRFLPQVSFYGILNVAWGFLITYLLFAVMNRTSGMVDMWCKVVVLLGVVLIFCARHAVLFAGVAETTGVAFLATGVLEPLTFAFINYTAAAGSVVAGLLCKDGNDNLDTIVEMLMKNPLTGGRA